MYRSLTLLGGIALLAMASGGCAQADQTPLITVTGHYQAVADGYRYYFAIYNNTDPVDDYHVGDLTLHTVNMSKPFDLASPPPPWFGVVPGLTIWSISEFGPPPNWNDGIGPGKSLAGFAFTSTSLVDSLYYIAVAYNGSGSTGNWGDLHPEPVPEPASIVALGAGVLGIAGLALRRRLRC